MIQFKTKVKLKNDVEYSASFDSHAEAMAWVINHNAINLLDTWQMDKNDITNKEYF